jgi:hypothetical protein
MELVISCKTGSKIKSSLPPINVSIMNYITLAASDTSSTGYNMYIDVFESSKKLNCYRILCNLHAVTAMK